MEILSRFTLWRRSLLGVACLPQAVCMVQLSRSQGHIQVLAHASCHHEVTPETLRQLFNTLQSSNRRVSCRVALAIPEGRVFKHTLTLSHAIPRRHLRALVALEAQHLLSEETAQWHLDYLLSPPVSGRSGLRELTWWAITEETLQACTADVMAAGLLPVALEPASSALARVASAIQNKRLLPAWDLPAGFLLAAGLALRGMTE
ncbi:hypothetical protein Lgee_1177 [Legionella geestiana]|uniref:Uncharacterized protein n=1 Tax=Legionella geestiana TaxID=45065 RepID=A0A0W0TW70_9GAMM|nr:hypothetical protein [Legionella geestiana]KTC99685.1 hypothetical protein Lgee_1177 [Legionella geestiana]QBS13192.1 hypothetical protein E4T54_10815 [Legionella geestiana]STX54286.1 Uncharacterised protein [Legionella geestiana]